MIERLKSIPARLFVAGGVLLAAVTSLPAALPQENVLPDVDLTAPPASGEIARLIGELSDDSFAQRERATRRLCAIGGPAVEALRAAADGRDAERSLRAAEVLDRIDEVLFSGLDVSLTLSRDHIAWDESVHLRVTFRNPGHFPARLPIDVESISAVQLVRSDRATAEERNDAAQVGLMMDLADYLIVRGESGRRVDLMVNDITDDPAVEEAVRRRADGSNVMYTLRPGEHITLEVSALNRGWARFPLLDAGAYVFSFEYSHPWDDPVLRQAQVGRVVSNEARLKVTRPAPEAISRTTHEASLTVTRVEGSLAAFLTNHRDVSVFVNLNFGTGLPFAEGVWMYESDSQRREIAVVAATAASWKDFSLSRLIEVAPGGRIELTRLDNKELARRLEVIGERPSREEETVSFRYVNLCNRLWQRKQDSFRSPEAVPPDETPTVIRQPWPMRILTGTFTSHALTAAEQD